MKKETEETLVTPTEKVIEKVEKKTAKAEEKKPARRRGRPKKAEAKAPIEASVTIEYQGMQISADRVVSDVLEKIGADVSVKTLDVYVKPEEGVAYYVVNGEGSEEYKVKI